MAHGTAAMYGIAADYQFERRIPPVVNDADATARALKAAASVFGEKVFTRFPPSTAGDDFAFFGPERPGLLRLARQRPRRRRRSASQYGL